MPEWDRAVIDPRKLTEYCLSPVHLRGRHKAKVFELALGLGRGDAAWLRDAILRNLAGARHEQLEEDRFGARWRSDLRIARHGRTAMVRTVWIVAEDRVPRLLTCWVL